MSESVAPSPSANGLEGLIIPSADGMPIERRQFDRLEDYQRAVGGWIEAVDIVDIGATAYVSESGPLLGLPFSRRATLLWRHHVPAAVSAVLVGDAALVGLPGEQGESTSLPERTLRLLLSGDNYVVEQRPDATASWHPASDSFSDYFEAAVWACLVREIAPGPLELRISEG